MSQEPGKGSPKSKHNYLLYWLGSTQTIENVFKAHSHVSLVHRPIHAHKKQEVHIHVKEFKVCCERDLLFVEMREYNLHCRASSENRRLKFNRHM